MNKDEFYYYLKENLYLELNDTQRELLSKYANLLIQYNEHTNITAIKDLEGVYLKHFYDSLTIVQGVDLTKDLELLDIGSGGGFPGIVLAIVFPNLKITSLDSNHKKTDFQKYIIDKLNISNVEIVNERAEDYFKKGKKFNIVVARAVANLQILSELCIPFTLKNGLFIAMKGNIDSELKDAEYAIKFLGGSINKIIDIKLPITNDNRKIIMIEKIVESPIGYPRSYDKITKRPLKG